jgi:L-alanine-DL-glutamate epimerase-like enolase superfamily enzyme
MRLGPAIDELTIDVLRLPTAFPRETDGTAEWRDTTMVLVELHAGGTSGLGYSYVDASAATVVKDLLEQHVLGTDAFATTATHIAMVRAVRNHGRQGVAACAIAAVDVALWDLRARLLGVSVAALAGAARTRVPVYASGGFTSTPPQALAREIERYVDAGHRRIKIKIDNREDITRERVTFVRSIAGPDVELMVDANGACTAKQALAIADHLEALGVVYFEEPVSSDDLAGLHLIRERTTLSVAAGEYGYDVAYFQHMLDARAVDILQADATRCLGITGFLQADALADAYGTPLSAHCAPSIHAQAGAAARRLVHVEHFFDHVRFEALVFDGAPRVQDGELVLDTARPGLGLELRGRRDVERSCEHALHWTAHARAGAHSDARP